jgi:hypothetical protein
MKSVVALMLSVLLLAACGERPQSLAGKQVKGSEAAWQGPATAFTAPGWKVGDQDSWAQHMQVRAQGQNEYVRIGAGK